MQIHDGEMFVTKSRNYENSYYTKDLKKDKESGEYMVDENGRKIAVIKSVYLPDGTELGDFSHIRFKGYTSFSLNGEGNVKEYIVITEIIEVLESNNNASSNFNVGAEDDDLPF